MNIFKDNIIRNKWHQGFNRDANPTEITIHATGGGGTLGYVREGGRKELYVKGVALFHYLVNIAGEVIEIIDPDKWVYHSSSMDHDKTTIGIEIEKASGTNSGLPSVQQMKSLTELIEHLCGLYPIDTISTHDYNRKKYSNLPPKPCPGDFDWTAIEYKFKNITINKAV